MTARGRGDQGKTSVLRLSRTLTRAAEQAGALYHRKPNQQIEYWASLGRALESTPGVSRDRIEAALAAALDFDALNAEERVVAVARLNEMEATWQSPPMQPREGGVLYAHESKSDLVAVPKTAQPKRSASPRVRDYARTPSKRASKARRKRRQG